ncbi:MAG: hypothetical protein ACTTJW_03620 [Sphaerochaeta sp.]
MKKEIFKKLQESGSGITVTDGDITLTGVMFGNDECFDLNNFYQYLLTEDGNLYKCWYDTEGCNSDFGRIDYSVAESISPAEEMFYKEKEFVEFVSSYVEKK